MPSKDLPSSDLTRFHKSAGLLALLAVCHVITASELMAQDAAGSALEVDVSTLKGDQHTGQLLELTESSISLKTAKADLQLSVWQLLEVRRKSTDRATSDDSKLSQVVLLDGSRISCSKVTTTGTKVAIESPVLGSFVVPVTAIANIRLAAPAPKLDQAWNELCQRTLKRDLLVIPKQDVLDHLDGVVGEIDDQFVKFLLDGDEIPVKRDKVFGVVYYRRRSTAAKPTCRIELMGSDVIQCQSITWDGKNFRATLLAGAGVLIPFEKLGLLDFSLGKVLYLSQIEPRQVKYTPFFDVTFQYRRNRNLDGEPLRLDNKTYTRGLAIHSKTYLRYRIGSDYRRFQAVMGIDKAVAPMGDVHVVISGDGKKLLEADVRGTDKPRVIDLDVSGVRDLEILVDFGRDLDIADHLDLADARVIK